MVDVLTKSQILMLLAICEDTDMEDILVMEYQRQPLIIPRQRRSFYSSIPKQTQWYTLIVPNLPPNRYRFFFRMSTEQFDFVLREVMAITSTHEPFSQVPIKKMLHMYLYQVGNNAYLAEMDDRFACASPQKFTKYIATVLAGPLYKKFVRWPDAEEKERIKLQWEDFTGFKNIIGAVDGTHIQILGNGKYKAGYTSRKCVYAVNLTVVCDFNLRILYASIGCPGSYHDNRVWKYTPIFKKPQHFFDGYDVLLGDSAYTDSQYLISPYRVPSATDREKITFNY